MEELQSNLNNQGQEEASEVQKLNFLQRFIGVITSPEATMKSIISKPTFLIPMIFIAVISFGVVIMNFQLIMEFSRQAMDETNRSNNVTMTSEQLDMVMNFTKITTLVVTPIGGVVAWLLGTILLFGLMKAFKGEGKLTQYLSITGYTYILIAIGSLLGAAFIAVTGKYTTTPITSIATILPESMSESFIYKISRGLELFTLWNYYVVGIGVSLVSNVSKKKVYTAIGIIFAVSLIFTGIMG